MARLPRGGAAAGGGSPRILIVRLSALGDVLHALPVLSGLRSVWPGARIDWAVEDRAVDLLAARSDLDGLVELPRRAWREAGGLSRPRAARRVLAPFVARLRAGAYDVALDLQGNLKSGLVTRASRARLRLGPSRRQGREAHHLFLSRRVGIPGGLRHRVERNLHLAGALVGRPLPYVPPGFPRSEATRQQATALLEGAGLDPVGGHVLLHPGTSGFGRFKRWPADRMAALARRLAADGHTIALSGGPGERGLLAEVAAASGLRMPTLEPAGLGVLAEVQARAALVVAPDTGPLHLAALVGTPVLGLFGPKDPAVYGPYGVRADGSVGVLDVALRDDVACRPCRRRRCANPLCMTTLEPTAVHARARALLVGAPGSDPTAAP